MPHTYESMQDLYDEIKVQRLIDRDERRKRATEIINSGLIILGVVAILAALIIK